MQQPVVSSPARLSTKSATPRLAPDGDRPGCLRRRGSSDFRPGSDFREYLFILGPRPPCLPCIQWSRAEWPKKEPKKKARKKARTEARKEARNLLRHAAGSRRVGVVRVALSRGALAVGYGAAILLLASILRSAFSNILCILYSSLLQWLFDLLFLYLFRSRRS